MGCREVIKISTEMKDWLDYLKEYKRETYNDVLIKVRKKLNNILEEENAKKGLN